MPKPKIPNSRKAALEHRKRIERYAALINQLYDKLNKEAAKIALSTGHDPATQFLWSDYPETRKALKDLQEQYVSDMKGIVMAGTSAEWKESNLVQDLVAQKLLKAYTGTTKAGEEYARYFQTDPDALKAFQQRKAGGMNLSKRVWNLSEQYKTELEMALSAAIEPGTSAMELAADIKTYLNEPDKMFRRFRYKDEEGNWQRKWKQKVTDANGKVHFIDADPKAYHPGRGVYRSSARNAQRLARTEINMAYRKAEQERWKSFDFVVGYEVKITQNGKHVEDICDCLKGKYRKDFKFMGWHPQCMCYTIPILKTEDEFFDDDDDAKSVNEVDDVPQGFKDWVKDNKERIDKAAERGKLPYFIADNRAEVNRILEDKRAEERKKTPQEIAKERHAARKPEDVERIQTAWNNKLLNDTITTANRLGLITDNNYQSLALMLKDDIASSNFKAFKNDYALVKAMFEKEMKAQTSGLTFTTEQIKRFAEIEKTIGIKRGGLMTCTEADILKANPNYKPNSPTSINCQTCAPAYVLRCQGFDLYAKGRAKGLPSDNLATGWFRRNDPTYYKTNSFDCWLNTDGSAVEPLKFGEWMSSKGYKRMTEGRYIELFEEYCKEPGIYEVVTSWKGAGGHATIVQRFSDGSLEYIEPQWDEKGIARWELKKLAEGMSIMGRGAILRVDDKLFDMRFISIFSKK